MTELDKIRKAIDHKDELIKQLLCERLDLARKAADYKKLHGVCLHDIRRENEIISGICDGTGEKSGYLREIYLRILEMSKKYQLSVAANDN